MNTVCGHGLGWVVPLKLLLKFQLVRPVAVSAAPQLDAVVQVATNTSNRNTPPGLPVPLNAMVGVPVPTVLNVSV